MVFTSPIFVYRYIYIYAYVCICEYLEKARYELIFGRGRYNKNFGDYLKRTL